MSALRENALLFTEWTRTFELKPALEAEKCNRLSATFSGKTHRRLTAGYLLLVAANHRSGKDDQGMGPLPSGCANSRVWRLGKAVL